MNMKICLRGRVAPPIAHHVLIIISHLIDLITELQRILDVGCALVSSK